jgi:hypothetical protein
VARRRSMQACASAHRRALAAAATTVLVRAAHGRLRRQRS